MKIGAFLPGVALLGGLTNAMSDSDIISTRSLLPRAPLSDIYLYARENLEEDHPLVRDLLIHVRSVSRNIIERRMAMPLAKGSSGGKPKTPPKQNAGGSGSGGGTPPPGLDAEGSRAWNQCQKAQASAGDCSAMRGPFAEMGCGLGSIHNMKPCENKNLQAALSKQYCSTPDGKANKKQCK